MKQALLDSDTLSFYFKGNPSVIQKIDSYLLEYGFVHISVITYYELLNGLLFKDARAQLNGVLHTSRNKPIVLEHHRTGKRRSPLSQATL